MKKLLFVLSLSFLGWTACTKKKDASGMPTWEIAYSDRACTQDSDCRIVADQCSCSCGMGVNQAHVSKYRAMQSQNCRGYTGKMCKMDCDGTPKCFDKVCSYLP